MFDTLFRESALFLVLLSGIPLVVSGMSALFVSIIQAATQIQEQSITYLVKVSTLLLVLVFLWPWMGGLLVQLFTDVLAAMPHAGRSR